MVVVKNTFGVGYVVFGKTANGFVMSEASSTSLLNAIKQALNVYKNDAVAWKQIQINGMNLDLTWDKSALAYLAAYQALLTPSP